MAQTPEKVVKTRVASLLDSEGVYHFFPATHGYGRSGVPDIVACINGQFLGIECKAKGNKPTALQVRELERIRHCGGVAVVVDETNWDMLRELLRSMKGSTVIGREQEVANAIRRAWEMRASLRAGV